MTHQADPDRLVGDATRLCAARDGRPAGEKSGTSGDGEHAETAHRGCLLYTSDAADERSSVDLGGRRIIKKKKHTNVGEKLTRSTHMYREETENNEIKSMQERYR